MIRVLWVFDILSDQSLHLAAHLAPRPDIALEVMCRWTGLPPQLGAPIALTQLACRHKLDFEARKGIRDRLRTGHFDIVHAYDCPGAYRRSRSRFSVAAWSDRLSNVYRDLAVAGSSVK